MENQELSYQSGEAGCRLLERSSFFVKEHVGFLKLTDTYDILDPATQEKIGIAKEEPPTWTKVLRLLTVKKHMLPTVLNVYEHENEPPVFSVHRPFVLFRSKVKVIGPGGESLGYFKSKFLSLGGGFYVHDNSDQRIAEVKGDWKGWNFRFLTNDGREIGVVTKKWGGLGRELFTSADNYIISLSEGANGNSAASILLLAAGLAIDVVYKERD